MLLPPAQSSTNIHVTQGYLVACLLKLNDDVPNEEEMVAILQIAAEAATATCEKDGAMEAMPTLQEVQKRMTARGLSWPDFVA